MQQRRNLHHSLVTSSQKSKHPLSDPLLVAISAEKGFDLNLIVYELMYLKTDSIKPTKTTQRSKQSIKTNDNVSRGCDEKAKQAVDKLGNNYWLSPSFMVANFLSDWWSCLAEAIDSTFLDEAWMRGYHELHYLWRGLFIYTDLNTDAREMQITEPNKRK